MYSFDYSYGKKFSRDYCTDDNYGNKRNNDNYDDSNDGSDDNDSSDIDEYDNDNNNNNNNNNDNNDNNNNNDDNDDSDDDTLFRRQIFRFQYSRDIMGTQDVKKESSSALFFLGMVVLVLCKRYCIISNK